MKFCVFSLPEIEKPRKNPSDDRFLRFFWGFLGVLRGFWGVLRGRPIFQLAKRATMEKEYSLLFPPISFDPLVK